MKFRLFGAAIAGAMAIAAMPAAAQQMSDSYQFLEAVKNEDGVKVQKFLSDATLRIVNTKSKKTGEGALHIVTNRSDALYLRVLLQQPGINANLQDARGNTALILAASRGWEEGVTLLIRYGANVGITNAAGETALIHGVLTHNPAIVTALLEAGADPDRSDNVGMSARDYAARETRYPRVAKLLADAKKVERNTSTGPRL